MKQSSILSISKKKLAKLLHVIPSIISESNIEALLQQILANTRDVMQAERSSIFILDEEKNELWTFVTAGGDTKEIRISADKGIVGWVVQNKETLRIKDAYKDERFEKGIDKSTGFRTRAIMAMPIVSRDQKILGVLEVLNKRTGFRYFTEKDKKLLEAFCSLVAISLENSMNVISLQKSLDSLSRYSTSPQILQLLKNYEDPTRAGARLEKRAVLFSDIRDFTAKSKNLPPEEVVSFLNEYFQKVHEAILHCNGNIEKIMGDSVMASFESCDNALECTDRFLQSISDNHQLRCGIGLSYGGVLIGNIGSKQKLDYTLIGDIVNLASRLEKLTKKAHFTVLTSKEFYDNLSKENTSALSMLGRVKIRGYVEPVPVYGAYKTGK